MPRLRDFRADFRKGRTGRGMRVRQDTEAYASSVAEAENMMVLPNGVLRRRWGSRILRTLPANPRCVEWVYAGADGARFLLVFLDNALEVYSVTGTVGEVPILEQQLGGTPWSTAALPYLQVAAVRETAFITDSSFRTQVLRFDPLEPVGARFSLKGINFRGPDNSGRRRQPFVPFASEVLFTPRVFLSAKTPTGYGPHLASAFGYTDGVDFDLDAGTGRIDTDERYFDPLHVGLRLRLLGGEVEITEVVNPRRATIRVVSDLAVALDSNPLWLRKASRLVELAWPSHGLKSGDQFFLMGLPQEGMASDFLIHTPRIPTAPGGASTLGVGGSATLYTVRKLVDENHFEFAPSGGVLPTNTELGGGADLYAIPFKGTTRVTEEAFSALRGWPQAACIHDARLWLGGSESLPDFACGSVPFDYENFDAGTGSPADAVVLAGIGSKSKVLHLVSHGELQIFTTKGVHYVPELQDTAVSQETVRAPLAAQGGASFVPPVLLDGGTFYVESTGRHVREMSRTQDGKIYTDQPLTIVVPDWIKTPVQACTFVGTGDATMAYAFFVQGDGSLLVMHSSRNDEAFGFMRWAITGDPVRQIAAVDGRLFAVVTRGGLTLLVEFDPALSTDLTEILAGSGTAWDSATHAGREVEICVGDGAGTYHARTTLGGTGDFTTAASATRVLVGAPMPFGVTVHPAVVQTPGGNMAGRMVRLVDADIHWREASTGSVHGWPVAEDADEADGDFDTPMIVDGWRNYTIGDWGTAPMLRIEGDEPGFCEIEAINLRVYF